DKFTRESLAIEVSDHLGGHRVAEVLMRLGEERHLPKTIRVDNGPEFISKKVYWFTPAQTKEDNRYFLPF
ncbi:transposase family protein, partial [Chloroflexota bacterium]